MSSVIDLKQTQVLLQDGYGGSGAVNHSMGYAIGVGTALVDAIDTNSGTGFILAVGDTLTFASHDTVYTITAHSETASHTTSITFLPLLTDAVADDEVLTILPHSLEMKIGEGNLTYTEKKNRIYIRNRGLLDGIKDGDQEPMDVSFDIMWEHLISASGEPILPNEAIQRIGAAAEWISSSADPCEPYAIDIVLIYTPLCPDVDIEKITLQDFRWETLDHSTKDGTISAKGTCNHSTALVERIAA